MKIETTVTIEKCLLSAKGVSLKLGRMRLNMGQHQEIYRMIQDQEQVRVSLEGEASLCRIENCAVDADGDQPRFDGLAFSSAQFKKLAQWVKDAEEVTIVIEPGEPNMFAGSDENLFDQPDQKKAKEPADDDWEELEEREAAERDGDGDEPDGEEKPSKQGKAKPGKKKRQRKVKDLMAGEA